MLRWRDLAGRRPALWGLAFLLGWLTAMAVVTLLALSGWFITASAAAGLLGFASAASFNYFGPAAIIRLCAIVRTAGRYGERLASHQAVLNALADLRARCFSRLSHQAISRNRLSSRAMHRLVSDIDTLNEWPLAVVLPWLWGISLLLIYLFVLAMISFQLAWAMVLPLILAGVIIPGWGSWRAARLTESCAVQREQRREHLLAPLSAFTALLQWGRWPEARAQFERLDGHYSEQQLQLQRFALLCQTLQQGALLLAYAILLITGGELLARAEINVELLLALLLALFGIQEFWQVLATKVDALGWSRAARNRLNALAEDLPGGTAGEKCPVDATNVGEFRVENLSVCQPGALNGPEDVSFTLIRGQIMIIQGASGSGKTTLLAALAGELPTQNGQCRYQDKPLSAWQWAQGAGYLGQQLDIFDLSLAENLRLGNAQATNAQLWQALKAVGLSEWAAAQPQQLETILGEYGSAISGGQARRVALARLLLKPYAVLLLDEPFAGLPSELQQALYQRLCQHQRHGILVIVSHDALNWGDDAQLLNLG